MPKHELQGSWYSTNELSEIWKPIPNYEGYYEVSNLGNVRSVDREYQKKVRGGVLSNRTHKGVMLRASDNGKYLTVSLSQNGRSKTHAIHKLVASAFVPNPNNLPQINHKDENKRNNCADNLEWCTASYNTTYGSIGDRKSVKVSGEKNPRSRLTEFDVRNIRLRCNNGESYKTLGEEFGVSPDTIYQIVTKRRWKHIG